MLAYHAGALHSGPQGFFWLFGGGSMPNERRGDVAIVHIRGGLEHHASARRGDSYEAIDKRYADACTGVDAQRAHEREHHYDDGYEPIAATPPAAVVFCIDSPGGSVAGLFEGVRAVMARRKESGIPLIAFVNETAASAAYALACACDEIICPATSAILGSVGAISTMASQAEADKRAGVDYRLITSGARKGDGHPHAPISDEAEAAEQGRVNTVAKAFWKLVAKERGIPLKRVASLEAGIMLGEEAVRTGLADEVATLEEVIAAYSKAEVGENGAATKNVLDLGKKTRSLEHSQARNGAASATEGPHMSVKLTALIKRTKAAIAAEEDPAKLAALAADLAAYKKTEKHVEHTKTEEGEDEKDEDEKDEEEEESAKKSAKAEDGGDDEEAKSEKDDKKAAVSIPGLAALLNVPEADALGALRATMQKASAYDSLQGDVAALKKAQAKTEKNALIDTALAKHLISPATAKSMRKDSMADVKVALRYCTKPLVSAMDDDLEVPDGTPAGDVPANVKAIVEKSIAARGLSGKEAEAARNESYEAHRSAMAKSGGVH